MDKHKSSSPDDETWQATMRGSWLCTFGPLLSFFVVVAGEQINLPGWMTSLIIAAIWFGGLFLLVRTQFARRHRNADIRTAFWRSTVIGFSLVVAVGLGLYFIGQHFRSDAPPTAQSESAPIGQR